MIKALERAMARAESLSPELQDEIARIAMLYAGDEGDIVPLTSDKEANLAESEAEAERGEFASDAEIAAIWTKHGL